MRHCTSGYANFRTTPTPTPTAQPMIGTERLRTRINNVPAGWSSTFDIVLQCNTDHDTTGLCVTFGGAADWKSRQLKPTAQSTTGFGHRPMIDASDGMSGRMVRTWHDLVSVFCLLSSICFLSVFSMA
jgi:hypothetical protein